MVGLILWGFALVWFVVALIMIATSGRFPFNMGWWGFIFPVGQCFDPFACELPGRSNLVLCRCVHPADYVNWRRVGVSIFQGRFVCEFIPFRPNDHGGNLLTQVSPF